jgi:hypothetical protein
MVHNSLFKNGSTYSAEVGNMTTKLWDFIEKK